MMGGLSPPQTWKFHKFSPTPTQWLTKTPPNINASMLSFDSLNWLSRVGKGSCFSTNSEKVFLKPFQRALSPLNAVTLQFCFMNIVLIGSLFLSTLGQPWRSSTCFLESTSGSRLVNLLLQVAWNDQSSIEVITWIWYCSLGCLVKLSFCWCERKNHRKKKSQIFSICLVEIQSGFPHISTSKSRMLIFVACVQSYQPFMASGCWCF